LKSKRARASFGRIRFDAIRYSVPLTAATHCPAATTFWYHARLSLVAELGGKPAIGVKMIGVSSGRPVRRPTPRRPRAGKVAAMELALQITLVITSVLVILLVLLHRAKGGGLSTLFGGGMQSSLSGSTVVEKNLDRLTLFVTGIWLMSIIGVGLLIKYR
jgi:preprotein translocase subunit SecG